MAIYIHLPMSHRQSSLGAQEDEMIIVSYLVKNIFLRSTTYIDHTICTANMLNITIRMYGMLLYCMANLRI